jgi:hypothetical protein
VRTRVGAYAAGPGYTSTDLNGIRGAQTVEQGTDAIVRLACLGPEGPTGTFVNRGRHAAVVSNAPRVRCWLSPVSERSF